MRKLLSLAVAVAAAMAGQTQAKTLVFCSEASPENFYPAAVLTSPSMDAAYDIYNRLVEVVPGTTEFGPGLAQKWDISADGTVYTFHLRRGVKWQSNRNFKASRDFNADDVIFSFSRQWKENDPWFKVTSANHPWFISLGFPELLKSIDKVDDYTVKFTLTRPDGAFLPSLAQPFASILSKEYADTWMKARTPERLDAEPLGTGPYQMVQYQKDALIRYRAHAEYWGGKTPIENLVFAITPDPSVRWAKLRSGECHVMAYPNPADLDAMRKDPNIRVEEQTGATISYIVLQNRVKPFDDKRVRQAINMAINKKAIIEAVYQSTAIEAKNPIPPTMWSYNDDVKGYPYDPERAKKLLAEAGYPNGFTIDHRVMPVSRSWLPNGKRMGELVQGDLAKIGITVEVKTEEFGANRRRLMAGAFQTAQLGWTDTNGDPSNFLFGLLSCASAEGGPNVGGFCNKEFDALVIKARTMVDKAERTALYRQAQVIFNEEAPWVMIAHATQLKPMRKEVVNYKLNPLGRHIFYGVDLKP